MNEVKHPPFAIKIQHNIYNNSFYELKKIGVREEIIPQNRLYISNPEYRTDIFFLVDKETGAICSYIEKNGIIYGYYGQDDFDEKLIKGKTIPASLKLYSGEEE
jgi:hypothetical protein